VASFQTQPTSPRTRSPRCYAGPLQSQRNHGQSAGSTLERSIYVHNIIHRAFKDAVRWGRLARNPADSADPPPGGQKSDTVEAWDAPTLRRFLGASLAAEDRLHPLWVLLATTGMRRGEALGLRWRDVDFEGGRVSVVQTIIQIGTMVSISEPKTRRGRRAISLDPATVAVLREHRRRVLEERLLVGPDFKDLDLIFHKPGGPGSGPTPSARCSYDVAGATTCPA